MTDTTPGQERRFGRRCHQRSRGTSTEPGMVGATPVVHLDPDNGSPAVSLPFGFPFYGQSHSTIYVSANGYIAFAHNQATQPPLATTAGIFPFAKDLKLGTGLVETLTVPATVTPTAFHVHWQVQAAGAAATDTTHYETFTGKFTPTGAVTYTYGTMAPTAGGNTATSPAGVSPHVSYGASVSGAQ